jgi:hypothetical protein
MRRLMMMRMIFCLLLFVVSQADLEKREWRLKKRDTARWIQKC